MTSASVKWKAVCLRNIRTNRNLKNNGQSMTSSSPRGWRSLPILIWMCPSTNAKPTTFHFVGKSLEGRNWIELVRDIKESNYDLVIMGALGLGAIKDSQIGTVTERVIRRIETDTLIVKHVPAIHKQESSSDKIVVAVDGSGHSYGGLKTAIDMAKALNKPIEVISTFDPYFHYAMFNSLTGVLSKDAAKVFKFEQQEKLHEDIIDKGLAKIYQSHLEVSRKMVEDEGMECTIRLLDGKVFEKVLQYAREENPYMLILGRIGVHSAPDMDIGGNTENLLRMVPCNVYLSSRVYKPPIDMLAEESIDWTAEAKERLKRIPGFVRPMATSAILRYALERGHSMITSSVITEACEKILPAGAMQAMYGIGDQMREKVARGEDPLEGMIEDRGRAMEQKFAEEVAKVQDQKTLKCNECGTIVLEDVVKCGVCGAGAESLFAMDKSGFQADSEEQERFHNRHHFRLGASDLDSGCLGLPESVPRRPYSETRPCPYREECAGAESFHHFGGFCQGTAQR